MLLLGFFGDAAHPSVFQGFKEEAPSPQRKHWEVVHLFERRAGENFQVSHQKEEQCALASSLRRDALLRSRFGRVRVSGRGHRP